MFNQFNPRSVTFNILFLNILVFIAANVLNGHQDPYTGSHFQVSETALLYGALHYPGSPDFKPVQFITYMFLHQEFLHIFGNMFGLFMFGSILERVWGPKRFFVFYFITGFGAALVNLAVQSYGVYRIAGTLFPDQELISHSLQLSNIYASQMLGASGAIFGILVAFGMLFPNMELLLLFFPVPIKAKYIITGYVCYEIFQQIANKPTDHVAHIAHLGGAVVGFILVKIWNGNRNQLY